MQLVQEVHQEETAISALGAANKPGAREYYSPL